MESSGTPQSYGIHIEICYILSDSSAAALVNLAQFAYLPLNACLIEDAPDFADILGIGIGSRALAVRARILAESHAASDKRTVVVLVHALVGRVNTGSYIRRQAIAILVKLEDKE